MDFSFNFVVTFILGLLVNAQSYVRRVPRNESDFQAIVGGDRAQPNLWRFVVRLQVYMWDVNVNTMTYEKLSIMCAGILIQPNYVITAAHCVKSDATNMKFSYMIQPTLDEIVIKGGDYSGNINHGVRSRVLEVRVHRDYGKALSKILGYDIALLRIEPFNFEPNIPIQIMPLPQINPIINSDTLCLAAGWGKDLGEDLQVQPSEFLQESRFRYICKTDCITNYMRSLAIDPAFKSQPFFCTENVGTGKIALGDSGGPLICLIGQEWQLVGLITRITRNYTMLIELAEMNEWVESVKYTEPVNYRAQKMQL